MTSTLSSSSRGYRPMGLAPASGRMPPPMPSALSKIALATRQNQILALQALQATATASTSSSSSSSSSPGSPPPAQTSLSSASLAPKRGRKFQACRAPSSASTSSQSFASASAAAAGRSPSSKTVHLITTTTPHWSPEGSYPLIDPSSGRRSEIYSLTNDRYPGAPGTALAKAREAQQKAIQTAKREAAKKLASKAELEHLGVKGLSKKRKSSSPYATIGGANGASTAATADKSAAMSRDSSRSRAAAAAKVTAEAGPASSSRSRRPASRSNSPVPITSAQSSTRRGGTRGASSAPAAEEDNNGKSANGAARSPSRGTSPTEGNLKGPHSSLVSTAPFQSSPLAAGSVIIEPSTEADMVEQDDKADNPRVVVSSDESPSAGRGSSLKRKVSTLSQEIGAEKPAEEIAASNAEAEAEPAKKAKLEDSEPYRETSPSSVSSSRRTSPRMKTRGLAELDKFSTDAEASNATKSRLSALSLEHASAGSDGSKRSSRSRRGAKSDVDAEEVRDEDLGGPGGKAA